MGASVDRARMSIMKTWRGRRGAPPGMARHLYNVYLLLRGWELERGRRTLMAAGWVVFCVLENAPLRFADFQSLDDGAEAGLPSSFRPAGSSPAPILGAGSLWIDIDPT